MGTNKRYAAQLDRKMDERIVASVIGEHQPDTLIDTELELDVEVMVRPSRAIAVRAWVRYAGVPLSVDAEAVAWTPRAVAVRWRTPAGAIHHAWVWSSAVRRT